MGGDFPVAMVTTPVVMKGRAVPANAPQSSPDGANVLFNTVLFTGNANPALAQEMASHLGIELGKASVGRFSDGEVAIEIQQNVRARDIFVVQPTCAPTNENLMELCIMVDALKRASARRVTAVIPYFGYARQDRRPRSTRVPISAKVVANMLEAVGVERLLTMDLHADQIQGFFNIPVDNIYASPVLLSDLQSKRYPDLVVVSPDVGGVVRARALAKQLGCDLAIIDKRRLAANVSEVMHVIGEIDGRNCVIMDDMIDTAGTLVKAAEVLKERGAKKVYAYCTHPIFSGPAIERITQGSALDEVVVTNTIPLSESAAGCKKIRQLTVAPLIAETIQRIAKGESVMSLFSDQDNLF
jgi:ribose-phosphate pyrophosphokinase